MGGLPYLIIYTAIHTYQTFYYRKRQAFFRSGRLEILFFYFLFLSILISQDIVSKSSGFSLLWKQNDICKLLDKPVLRMYCCACTENKSGYGHWQAQKKKGQLNERKEEMKKKKITIILIVTCVQGLDIRTMSQGYWKRWMLCWPGNGEKIKCVLLYRKDKGVYQLKQCRRQSRAVAKKKSTEWLGIRNPPKGNIFHGSSCKITKGYFTYYVYLVFVSVSTEN